MVKAVQAEDAVAEHFDALLKNRVAAEVCAVRGRLRILHCCCRLANSPTPLNTPPTIHNNRWGS